MRESGLENGMQTEVHYAAAVTGIRWGAIATLMRTRNDLPIARGTLAIQRYGMESLGRK